MSEVSELAAVQGLMSAYTDHYNRLRIFRTHEQAGRKLNHCKQGLATLKATIQKNNGQLPTEDTQDLTTLQTEILQLDETLAYKRSMASDDSLGKTIADYENWLNPVKEELEGIKTLPTQTQNPNLRNEQHPLENAQSQANRVKHKLPTQNQAA